jgi:hypothetical protein
MLLSPGRYCIIPCTFHKGESGDFLLRVFVRKRWGSSEIARGPCSCFVAQGRVSSRVLMLTIKGRRYQGWTLSPRCEVIPQEWRLSVCLFVLLNIRECSPLGVNEGVKGQSSPLVAKFTPRANVTPGVQLNTGLSSLTAVRVRLNGVILAPGVELWPLGMNILLVHL